MRYLKRITRPKFLSILLTLVLMSNQMAPGLVLAAEALTEDTSSSESSTDVEEETLLTDDGSEDEDTSAEEEEVLPTEGESATEEEAQPENEKTEELSTNDEQAGSILSTTIEGDKVTYGNISTDVTYTYPHNDLVSVKFLHLPEGDHFVSIEEVETEYGIGYEFLTDMTDGSFIYNLTLPSGDTNSEVKFSEDNSTYENVSETVQPKDGAVTVFGLNHFTVFVVVNPLPVTEGDSCTVAVGSGEECYDTIQEAVDAAEASSPAQDTIMISAGTYNENVIINTDKLTIEGPNAGIAHNDSRGAEAVINGYFKVNGDTITIDGLKFLDGGNVPAGELAAIHIVGEHNSIDILNSIFVRTGTLDLDFSRGIINEFGGINNFNVEYNYFSGWHTGVYTQHANSAHIEHNVFEGNMVGNSNDFPENVHVKYNEFLNNDYEGIGVGGSGTINIHINENYFSGNTVGISNYSSTQINAKNNDWDTNSGPYDPTSGDNSNPETNPSGSGDQVNGAVDYSNWVETAPTPPTADDSKFVGSPKYVRANNGGDLAAEVHVINTVTAVRFYLNGNGPIDGYYQNSVNTNLDRWRLKTPIPAGEYIVTGEMLVGDTWYPITGEAKVYSIDMPNVEYIKPSTAGEFFRPGDNPVRIKHEDEYNQFKDVSFELYEYDSTTSTRGSLIDTFTINRADCDLRQAGNYVLCDIDQASNWSPLPEGEYIVRVQSHTVINIGVRFRDNLWSDYFVIDSTRPTVDYFDTVPEGERLFSDRIDVKALATDTLPGEVEHVSFYIRTPRNDGQCVDNEAAGTAQLLQNVLNDGDEEYLNTFNTSGLVDGEYCLFAKAMDKAMNHTYPASSIKVEIDNTAPEALEITFPHEGDYFSSQPILNDWTDGSDPSGIDFYRIEYMYDDGHTFTGAPYRTTTISQRNHVPASWEEGGVTIRVQAFDNAGNEGAWSTPVHYYYDHTAPSAPENFYFETPEEEIFGCATRTNETEVTVQWDDSTDNPGYLGEGLEVQYYIYEITYINPDTGVPSTWMTTVGDSEYPGSFSPNGEGLRHIRVRAVDMAGNMSDWSEVCGVYYDPTPPEVPTPLTPADGDMVTNSAFTQTWTSVSDAVEYGYESCSVDPGDTGDPCTSVKYTNTYPSTTKHVGAGQPNSHFWWRVRAKDEVGNWSEWSIAHELYIDAEAPSTQITEPSDDAMIGSPIVIKGTTTDNLEVEEVSLYYSPAGEDNWTLIESLTAPEHTTNWNWTSNLWSPVDGVYDIKAQASDVAGNVEHTAYVYGITYDTTAPIVDITSHNDGDELQGTETIEGLIDEINLSHYNLSLYKDEAGTCNKEATWNFSNRIWQVSGNTNEVSHLLDTTNFEDGNYMIRLAARDLAGNRDPMDNEGDGVSVEVICVTINNLGSIQGTKFHDIDNNGRFDKEERTNENRLNGWTMSLYMDMEEGWEQVNSAVTSNTGRKGQLRFDDLEAGTYYLCEELQEGWIQTYPRVANKPPVDNNGHPVTDNAVSVMNQSSNENEAPYCWMIDLETGSDLGWMRFGNHELSSIMGYKFEDVNQNSEWDEGEDGLEGWTIQAWKVDEPRREVGEKPAMQVFAPEIPFAETETAVNGQYTLNLPVGNYRVCEVLQEDWVQTYPTEESEPTCHTVEITMPGSIHEYSYNFGNYEDLSPEITAAATPVSYVSGGSSVLAATITSTGNAPYTWEWSGDCSGNTQNINFNNSSVGTYNCTVTITDLDGDQDSANVQVTVTAPPITPDDQGETGTNPQTTTTGGAILGFGDGFGNGLTSNVQAQDNNEEDADTTGEQGEEEDGEVLGLTCDEKSLVNGYVYYDKDENQEKGEEEEGQSDVTIRVYAEVEGEKTLVAKTQTDENGYWEANLCPGDYTVELDSDDLPDNAEIDEEDATTSVNVGNEGVSDVNFELSETGFNFNYLWCLIPLIVLILLSGAFYFLRRDSEETLSTN